MTEESNYWSYLPETLFRCKTWSCTVIQFFWEDVISCSRSGLCDPTVAKTLKQKHGKNKCFPTIIQWTDDLLNLSTFECMAYSQQIHMDIFLDIWKPLRDLCTNCLSIRFVIFLFIFCLFLSFPPPSVFFLFVSFSNKGTKTKHYFYSPLKACSS